jgi:glycosyltransferase involved in cell wall biosynthesis
MTDRRRPLISVVVPAFNRANTLPRAISSVFSQTFDEWELIIIDDGSRDETQQLVSGIRDPRVRYLRHECNRGPSAARNTGIRAAQGTYIAFLDSDDEWSPEKLALDLHVFNSRDAVGLVYSGVCYRDPRGRVVRDTPSIQGRVYAQLLAHDFIGCCSRVALRKTVLDLVGSFDERIINEEDWDLWVRITERYEVGCVKDCPVIRHYGVGQITSSPGSLKRIYEGRALAIGKHRDRMPPAVLAGHMTVLAGLLFNYDIPAARKLARRSLGLSLWQPRLLLAVFISFLGLRVYRYLFSRFANLSHYLYMGRASV